MSVKLCCSIPVTLNCLKSVRLLFLVPKCLRIGMSPVVKHISVCDFTKHARWFATENKNKTRNSQKTEQKQKNPIKQIYYGPLSAHVRAVKLFSLSSSIVGLSVQPILYKEIMVTGNLPIILAAYSFIGFFTVITPLLLHIITKKYVTELLYNGDTDSYTAKSLSFFCSTKETEFKIDDVYVPDVPGMFVTFHIKGKPMFVDPRNFDNPDHYGRLMGFDKPMDFKLYDNDVSSKTDNAPAASTTTSSGSPNK